MFNLYKNLVISEIQRWYTVEHGEQISMMVLSKGRKHLDKYTHLQVHKNKVSLILDQNFLM
jgi:hypothetical protein